MSFQGSLGSFVLRNEVVKLYRQCIRACKQAPQHSREDLKSYARDQFELHRKKTEPYDIKYALSDGREQLKKLQETLAMQII